jgi:hypothetical protein
MTRLGIRDHFYGATSGNCRNGLVPSYPMGPLVTIATNVLMLSS